VLRDLVNRIDRSRIQVIVPCDWPDIDTFGVRLLRQNDSIEEVADTIGTVATRLVTFIPGIAHVIGPLTAVYASLKKTSPSLFPVSVVALSDDIESNVEKFYRDALVAEIRKRFGNWIAVPTAQKSGVEKTSTTGTAQAGTTSKPFDESPRTVTQQRLPNFVARMVGPFASHIVKDIKKDDDTDDGGNDDDDDDDDRSPSISVGSTTEEVTSASEISLSSITSVRDDDDDNDEEYTDNAGDEVADDKADQEEKAESRKRRRTTVEQKKESVFVPCSHAGWLQIDPKDLSDSKLVAANHDSVPQAMSREVAAFSPLIRAVYDGLADVETANWSRAPWFIRVRDNVDGIVNMGSSRTTERLKRLIELAYYGRIRVCRPSPEFQWPRKCALCGTRDVNRSTAVVFSIDIKSGDVAILEQKVRNSGLLNNDPHDRPMLVLNVYCAERALRLMHLFGVLGAAKILPQPLSTRHRFLLACYVQSAIDAVQRSACLSTRFTPDFAVSDVSMEHFLELAPRWTVLK
jgi:hypothetical protein